MVEYYCHIYGARETIEMAISFASDNDHARESLLASLQNTMCRTGTGCMFRCEDTRVSTGDT